MSKKVEMKKKNISIYVKILMMLLIIVAILGIGTQVKAVEDTDKISYTKFDSYRRYMCMNHAYDYDTFGSETFNRVCTYTVTDGFFSKIDGIATADEYEQKFIDNDTIVSYIASHISYDDIRKDDYNKHGNDEYQQAIWTFSGANNGSYSTDKGKQILANATAYKKFVEEKYIDSKPTIDVSSVEIVKEEGSFSIIGPFTIDYKTIKEFYGSKEGYYGEITSLIFNSSDAKSYVCNASGGTFDGNNTLLGYPASGVQFYLKVPTDQIKNKDNKITIEVNNQYRDATVTIWQNTKYAQMHQDLLEAYGSYKKGQADAKFDLISVPSITITKKNSTTGAVLSGVKFSVTITNVKSIDNRSFTGTTAYFTGTTDSSGQIKLRNVEVANESTNIYITLEELDPVPTGYKKIERKNIYNIKKEWR